ncbi:hypothetical protein NPIL_674681, partial [Nephila pilipes]
MIDSDSGKSSVILNFNKTKSEVDVVDKLGGTYTVARKTLGWQIQSTTPVFL